MKNLSKLFLGLLLTGIVFTGCKEATELVDVKFPANYETELDVTVIPSTNAKSTNGTFSVNETIDPTINSDYTKYLDNITGVQITKVTGLVLSVDPNLTLSSTVLSVNNDTYNATWEYTNLPITVGTELTLSNDNGQWDAIENILMEKNVFTLQLTGQADVDNANFVVLVSIESEITANPLN